MKTRLVESLASMSPEQLYQAMYMDPVTKCLNRRAFEECEPHDAIAIVDMDSLKWVNDNLGHRTGDALLEIIADKMIDLFGADSVYRLSGDEFVVTGDNTWTLDAKLSVAEESPFSFGVGRDLVGADKILSSHKQKREVMRLRSERGERPPWADKINHWVKYGL